MPDGADGAAQGVSPIPEYAALGLAGALPAPRGLT